MNKHAMNKLTLSKQTLRRLDPTQVAQAAGGLASSNPSVDGELKCFPTRPSNACQSDGCASNAC